MIKLQNGGVGFYLILKKKNNTWNAMYSTKMIQDVTPTIPFPGLDHLSGVEKG